MPLLSSGWGNVPRRQLMSMHWDASLTRSCRVIHPSQEPTMSFVTSTLMFLRRLLRTLLGDYRRLWGKCYGSHRQLVQVLSVVPTFFSESDFEYKAAPRSAHALIEAASRLAETEARREAEALAKTRRKQERHALFRDAAADLENIKHRLYRQIQTLADGAEVDRNDVLRLGAARLQIGAASELEEGIARKAGIRGLNWDMLAWSIIGLGCQLAPHTEYAWTASLIYSDGGRGEGFRWSEVAFWSLGTVSNRHEPFAIKGTSPDLYLALGPVIHSVAPAYGPLAIDGEDEEAFEDRWINLFSKAVTGLLRRPQAMPIDLDSLLQS